MVSTASPPPYPGPCLDQPDTTGLARWTICATDRVRHRFEPLMCVISLLEIQHVPQTMHYTTHDPFLTMQPSWSGFWTVFHWHYAHRQLLCDRPETARHAEKKSFVRFLSAPALELATRCPFCLFSANANALHICRPCKPRQNLCT